MEFLNFKQYFSASRVNRYLTAAGNSTEKAVELYKANLKVSQSFHPLLGILEVVLRNRLNDILTSYFADPDWITNQKTGFMSDPSLSSYTHKRTGQTKRNDFLKVVIKRAEKRLQKTGTPITSGKIIAEQTFGFWTGLFEVHHYRLLKGKPIQIFQTLPSGFGRKEVNDELGKIRRFRNRINHNEPICFNGNAVDFTETLAVYHSITNLLGWIDQDIVEFLFELDEVEETIDKAKSI
ncbi:MAG: Abi family protein [Mucilaginibacter sp.]|uniref:Abi family protein n=1 Tax=Mucilaginibacter sp. TaxID=1882438 RepID=UPI0034E609D4